MCGGGLRVLPQHARRRAEWPGTHCSLLATSERVHSSVRAGTGRDEGVQRLAVPCATRCAPFPVPGCGVLVAPKAAPVGGRSAGCAARASRASFAAALSRSAWSIPDDIVSRSGGKEQGVRGKELQCELETRTETKLRLPTGDVVGPCDPPRAMFGVGAPERTAGVARSS